MPDPSRPHPGPTHWEDLGKKRPLEGPKSSKIPRDGVARRAGARP
ncbi:hypothetical protein GA0070608_2083 [Micromonospora peucetia]|uniref:Uncharacterized protein n=1 Tax=Micromonospora peucetia TaxID=47871 RepID=A0A1C6UYH9_9ACTN|nr:hypothetical protein GA0070608_2083 [Micromonospora peucetia]